MWNIQGSFNLSHAVAGDVSLQPYPHKIMTYSRYLASIIIAVVFGLQSAVASQYQNFEVSVYTRAYEVEKMKDPQWLESTWETISSQLKVDKIYLESHRDLLIVDGETLENAIRFFKSKGLKVAGGITYTIDESNLFQTYCYSNPKYRKIAQDVIEHTARHFDEIILDDFFFTSCKCEFCIEAKGDRSWTDFRLDLMNDAARNIILKPAKAVNPDVKVIIKYPNWYEHFQGLGFDLENGPVLFDGIYTGTETRDAVRSNQHLQPYLGYLIWRYYNNLAPGKNGGGWVDPFGSTTLDRYGEQLWMTVLSKAPEMTLFDYRMMLAPLDQLKKASWQTADTSFDYDAMMSPVNVAGDTTAEPGTLARAAGYSLEKIDPLIGKLGTPYGIKSYKPFHSIGEDFLQNFIGMIGIPMDIVPEFPMVDEIILLTETARFDPDIVTRIHQRLMAGKDVMITSGLLQALQGKGIESIVELQYTARKAYVKDFMLSRNIVVGDTPMLIPQIQYLTNDSWELIEGMDGELGWPMLHQADYGNARLFVLTIPENFSDLYNLPVPVLDMIRFRMCKGLNLWMEGDSKVSLFLYDNNTVVVHSFRDEPTSVNLMSYGEFSEIRDLNTGELVEQKKREAVKFRNQVVQPELHSITIEIEAHSLRAFSLGSPE